MTKQDLVRYHEVRVADLRNDQLGPSQIAAVNTSSVTQEDYQQFLISQAKRIIWGDHAGHWYDDFESKDVASLADLVYDFLLDNDPVSAGVIRVLSYTGLQLESETWTFTASSLLIKQCTYTYSGLYAATAVVQIYDQTGATIVAQTTTTFTWSGGRLVQTTTTRDI